MNLKVRAANIEELDDIVQLSGRVQAALTALGSLQVIGPLRHNAVTAAITEQRCWVALEASDHASESRGSIIGCALHTSLGPADETSTTSDSRPLAHYIAMAAHERPHFYLHSVMLEPEKQGQRLGLQLVSGVLRHLSSQGQGGTIFLDCWAGNDQLRRFYERAGFVFVAVVEEEDYLVALYRCDIAPFQGGLNIVNLDAQARVVIGMPRG